MRTTHDMPDVHPAQKVTVPLDFGPALNGSGVTITSIVSVTLEVVEGTDPSPSSHLTGTPVIGTATGPFGSNVAAACIFQTIAAGCIEDVRYKLTAIAGLSNGNEFPLETFFDCKKARGI